MVNVSQKDHQLIQQMIFLPMLIHVLEQDRERILGSKQIMKDLYNNWINILLTQIQNDLRVVKQDCYRLGIKVSYKYRQADLLTFHCSSAGYIFDNNYTLSTVKWQLGILLKKYLSQGNHSNKTSHNHV